MLLYKKDLKFLKDNVKDMINDGVFNLFKIKPIDNQEYMLVASGKYHILDGDGYIITKTADRPRVQVVSQVRFGNKSIEPFIENILRVELYKYDHEYC